MGSCEHWRGRALPQQSRESQTSKYKKMWLQILLLFGLIAILLWKRYMDGFKRWSHLPGVAPHWFWGNKPMFSKNQKDLILDHYKALEGHRFGVYWSGNEPTIFLRDLELIKRVQVTDAHEYFSDFGFQPFHDNPPNQFGLADLKGERWWKMKRSVTPSFSTPRLKKNVPAMNEAAHYWPEPNKFDPERFSSDNKGSIDPVTFQTFGGGPRQCLGKNVYIVETKVLIVHLLRNFSVKPYGDMPKELVWDMNAFIGASKYEIKLEKRDH